MLQVTPHMRVLICVDPMDFRKGIDGFSSVCRNTLEEDPYEGSLFLFTSKSRSSIRILVYDGQGFWLCTKRLSIGRFQWWPASDATSKSIQINSWDLQTLLGNGNLSTTTFAKDWKKLPSLQKKIC
jgi:transposase